MSAFLVSPEHMNRIVTYAIDVLRNDYGPAQPRLYRDGKLLPFRLHDAQALGDLLYVENARSIGVRYGLDAGAGADADVFTYRYRRVPTITAVEFLKLCQSLKYQSCEAEDYHTTLAWLVLDVLMYRAISHLVGYDRAVWAA